MDQDAGGSLAAESVTAVNEQAIKIRSGTTTELAVFQDSFAPNKGQQYFIGKQQPVEHNDGYWILTVVTAYNEGGEEMAETLISLHEQAQAQSARGPKASCPGRFRWLAEDVGVNAQ
eukprot:scaffold342868_cov29-Prasinocladus_malaysianus.AAC.1